MKRKVTIYLEIDTTEYNNVEDSPEGAIALVCEILYGQADLPDKNCEIICEDKSIKVKI